MKTQMKNQIHSPAIYHDSTLHRKMEQMASLMAQAVRLEAAVVAVEAACSPFNAGPAQAAAAGERFWRIAHGHGEGTPVLANTDEVKRQSATYRARAGEIAREVFASLPAGTVLIGRTTRNWHTGCPHSPADVRLIAAADAVFKEYEGGADTLFRLLGDAGVNNSDNGRESGFRLGYDWEIVSTETPDESRKGHERDYLPGSNIYRQGGNYPPVKVVALRKGDVPPHWRKQLAAILAEEGMEVAAVAA